MSNVDGSGGGGNEGAMNDNTNTILSSQLPPPPTMPMSTAATNSSNNNNNGVSNQQNQKSHLSLPPPPKLNMNTSKTTISSNNISKTSMSLPPPPTLPSIHNKPPLNINKSKDGPTPRTAALLSELTETTININDTQPVASEQIPPLSSAPNSGSALVLDGLTALASTIGQSATEAVFPHPPQPPSVNVPSLDTPIFGVGDKKDSSTAFAESSYLAEDNMLAASNSNDDSGDDVKDSITHSMPSDVMTETPDNSVHPSVNVAPPPPPLVSELPVSASTATTSTTTTASTITSSASSKGLPPMPPRTTTTTTTTSPSRTQRPQLKPKQQLLQRQSSTSSQSSNNTTTTTKRRANAQPPLTVLAARQTRLSILILPTSDAQAIATKNNTTLTELFRVFGNSHDNYNSTQLNNSGHGRNNNELEPPLPPFRSANRSMVVSWDQISLDFMSIQDMEGYIPEGEAERALGVSARVWEEDVAVDLDTEEDEELIKLEQRVVKELEEEEEMERLRSEDGIPSMTSRTPSRGVPSVLYSEQSDNDTAFPKQPEQLLKQCADTSITLTSRPNTPWLLRFRHTLDCSTDSILGHELFRNPAVVILAASTSEPYINCFSELANVHHLPRPYHDGRYDPNGVRREFLLLHDVVNGPKDFDETRALQRMRDRFGPGCCQVLRLNSVSTMEKSSVLVSDGYNTVGETEEWESVGPGTPFEANVLSNEYGPSCVTREDGLVRGACLSVTDKRAIRRYVANMVATGLLPSLERRIAHLNATVTNAKKGVKNVIKSFWRKPKESMSSALSDAGGGNRNDGNASNQVASSETAKYRYDSIESQTRLLADTLFLMKDYEAALSIYRLVKDDFKHDKAHLYYASVQEMIVLCMFMIDPSKYTYDVQHAIETALYSYSLAADEEKKDANPGVRPSKAPYATRLATRLCLALSSARTICEGKHMEMADLLASASSHETPLGAAVLLERSSSHYYQANMIRKYAFHMLMAGHMFRSAGQERHAFRCFAASLYVYHGEQWGELRSHLHSALAAQLFGMNRFALAMQFYAKLIGSSGGGRVSVRSQQKFLNHLVDICRDHESEALVAVDRMGYKPNIAEQMDDSLRHIEISNVGFPHFDDTSLRISADSSDKAPILLGHADSLAAGAVGSFERGDDSIWEEMMICAESELRASSASTSIDNNVASEEESNRPNAVQSGDIMIDRIISEIDKEEREVEYRNRQKRKGNARNVEVRATSEPITVSFEVTNPLGLDIELTEMQLVASLLNSQSGLLHSNELPCSNNDSTPTTSKVWTFLGSDEKYERPNFMQQNKIDSESSEASPVGEATNPYFVVTKNTVKMTPSSSTVASLKICPLSKGDFNIIGVRFKLLGEVWIYHRFNIPGPLLQDTQLNRSKRLRGESVLLKSKIKEEMPSLKVSITPSNKNQSTVLQGQMSSWTLTISNFGYAPATNIVLKTNEPWLNICDKTEEEKEENSRTSHCIGSSGTLMEVPFMDKDNAGVLQPGNTIEIPVFIRTSGGGRQDFYMLCRYELWNEDPQPNLSSPRHRWARKLLSVPVYPSITMSASLMPSYVNNGEHILSVELMNYRSDRDAGLEVNFDNLCVISRHFDVKPLDGQFETDGTSNSLIPVDDKPSALEVGWQERVSIHYLVTPIAGMIGSCNATVIPFSNNESATSVVNKSNGVSTDFICRERAHDVFSSTLENYRVEKERLLAEQEKEGQPRHVAQIRRAKTSLQEGQSNISSSPSDGSTTQPHPTSIAQLCPSEGTSNINVICSWSASVGEEDQIETIVGQHHLRNLLIRPQSKSKGCPLAMTAKHLERVHHDFNASSHLDVDLEVTLRNRLVETDVEFEFVLEPQPEFDFVGTTSFQWSLRGGEEVTVPMKARFYAGGVYNLQSVRLTVAKSEASVPYLFPLQWTILVEEDS